MISLLVQERLLGFALGGTLAGVAVLEQRRAIRRSMHSHDISPRSTEASRLKFSDMDLAHRWNRAVDWSLGPLIAGLSSRGW